MSFAIAPAKWHTVKPEDQKRIACDEGCGKNATRCQHVERARSLSFYYYCEEHARKRGFSDGGAA